MREVRGDRATLLSLLLYFLFLFSILQLADYYLLKTQKSFIYFQWGSGEQKEEDNFIKTELKLNFDLGELRQSLPFEKVSIGLWPYYFFQALPKDDSEERALNLTRLISSVLNARVETFRYRFGDYGESLEERIVPNNQSEVFKNENGELILGVPPLFDRYFDNCYESRDADWEISLIDDKNVGRRYKIFVINANNVEKVVICGDKLR